MIVQLLINWIILSAASGCALAFLTYRDMIQAEKDRPVPTSDQGAGDPLPMLKGSSDDRVRPDYSSSRNKEARPSRECLKAVHPAASCTTATYIISDASALNDPPSSRSSQRSWPRRSARVRASRLHGA